MSSPEEIFSETAKVMQKVTDDLHFAVIDVTESTTKAMNILMAKPWMQGDDSAGTDEK